MHDFKKLETYKKAYNLSWKVYQEIKGNHNLRLKSQLFGAITSIPAHLAELGAYNSHKEKLIRLRRSIAEANEAEFWLDFCRQADELPIKSVENYIVQLHSIRKMLFNFLKTVETEMEKSR